MSDSEHGRTHACARQQTAWHTGDPQATLVVEKLQRHGRRHARSKRRPREIAKVSRDRQSLELSRAGYTIFSPMGMLRIRLPHAAKIAFANAGPKGGTPGSPTPPA